MTYYMNLHPQPFALIANRQKTIELRLYDEKRQQIKPGDTIVFSSTQKPEDTITAKVKMLHVFPSFEELYKTLPLELCGYLQDELSTASPKDMEIYYSPAQQEKYGVVGIELVLT